MLHYGTDYWDWKRKLDREDDVEFERLLPLARDILRGAERLSQTARCALLVSSSSEFNWQDAIDFVRAVEKGL